MSITREPPSVFCSIKYLSACILLYSIVFYCILLYSIVFYCIVLNILGGVRARKFEEAKL